MRAPFTDPEPFAGPRTPGAAQTPDAASAPPRDPPPPGSLPPVWTDGAAHPSLLVGHVQGDGARGGAGRARHAPAVPGQAADRRGVPEPQRDAHAPAGAGHA